MMKFTKTTLILTLLIFCAAIFGSSKVYAQTPAQLQKMVWLAEDASGDTFPFITRTDAGARVFSYKQPSANMLAAIDDGLTDLFEIARKNGYHKRLHYSDYTIFIARPDKTSDFSGNYIPAIMVGAAQYAGTEYDKGGYIYAAGMVLAFNPMAFIIADYTQKFEQAADVVRYEGEHLILYHNDRRRFSQTRDHNANNAHPILN